ncbi:MAG TPA: hypothetical protein VIY48_01040, partial [Candidatus Paceibacterota bacterium]
MNRTWVITAAVVIIIAVLLFIFRAPITGLFHKQPATTTQTQGTTTEPETQHYSNAAMGISLSYPIGFTLNPTWQNTTVNPKKPISGVQLIIPTSMATGTNLSTDTYVSVEQLPRAKSCTGDIFLAANVKPTTVVDNGVTYSVASSTDAAAGNRYEETVYAIKGSSPCTAVRYLVHYGVFENYPAG